MGKAKRWRRGLTGLETAIILIAFVIVASAFAVVSSFKIDRLQMEGFSPGLRLFQELMGAWGGFTLTGDEADEGSDELMRSPRLMNPKTYVCL
ncbi:MAG: hypothetical protein NXY59_01385 [Aigarchaeota archaeon]|nr:hypothetical protein [Candidatus Pelearchaeum maunauluense]